MSKQWEGDGSMCVLPFDFDLPILIPPIQLPEFSEVSRLRQLSDFSEGKVTLPDMLKITHVSLLCMT